MRRAKLQNAMTRGCLDPDLWDRYDLAHYYLALADATNCVGAPQGGIRNRPGTICAAPTRLRHQLQPIPLTAAMIILHNGGTASAVIDQNVANLFTTSAVATATFAAIEFDLGVAQPVCFVDVVNYSNAAAGVGGDHVLAVEYYNGTSWAPMPGSGLPGLNTLRGIRNAARTRRFGGAPGTIVTARNWRVTIYNGIGLGAISVGQVRFWAESTKLSPVKLIPSAKELTNPFIGVLTHRNLDLFKEGLFVASVPVAASLDILTQVAREQVQDTLWLFHEDLDTPVITRQSFVDEWDASPMAPTNVANLVAGAAYSGSQNEIQETTIVGLVAGAQFVVMSADMVSAPIVFSTQAQLLIDVAAALQALPGFATGLTVTAPASGALGFRVEYSGTGNVNRRWPRLEAIGLLSYVVTATTAILQRGVAIASAVFGATNGWPRCGMWYNARLWLGGFRAAPSSLYIGRAGQVYDFTNTGAPVTADLAILTTIDNDHVETIIEIMIGRNFMLFTESSEWWTPITTVDATQPLGFAASTRYGSQRGLPHQFIQDAVTFVQSGGYVGAVQQPATVVRDSAWDWGLQTYKAEPLSIIGGHLLSDLVAVAHRVQRNITDGGLILFVNRDGRVAFLNLLRSQDVTPMTPGLTDGFVRDACVDQAQNLWWAAERPVSATTELYLERLDDATLLDGTISIASAVPLSVVTGLSNHEGRQVYAYVDKGLQGPFTVANGQITLTVPGLSIQVGRPFTITGGTLPLREKLQQAEPFRFPVRIQTVEWSVAGCGPFEMAVNGGDFQWISFNQLNNTVLAMDAAGLEQPNDILGTPTLNRTVTGYLREEGLRGFTRHGRVQWRRTLPYPFHVKALRMECSF